MNRIIIVGNGFDLAFGLPTRYVDFFSWYFKEKVISGLQQNHRYSDDLWSFSNHNLKSFCKEYSIDNIKYLYNEIKECSSWNQDGDIDSILISSIFESDEENWSDIENCYFKKLVSLSKNKSNREKVKKLNKEFNGLQKFLVEYLKTIDRESPEDWVVGYSSLTKPVNENLIHESHLGLSTMESYDLENFLIINFNYTKTAAGIMASVVSEGFQCDMVSIHGKLSQANKQIILGYGDETDSNFQILKDMNDDLYLEHFKSYKYSRSNNLRKIFSFIDNSPYDVHVIGHSCGLSDRVLLSSIFDNEYCLSIVPYIRKDVNNYFTLQTAISRHIKNMSDYRKKIMIEPECPRFSR